MKSNEVLKVIPMANKRGWNASTHFNHDLQCPGLISTGGMVIQLEACARECLAVALSPEVGFEFGRTYVVHFGAGGNLKTVIRRRISSYEHVDASFPSYGICTDRKWVRYWIAFQRGMVKCGVGSTVGENVVCELDDSLHFSLSMDRSVDMPRYVGIGNSSVSKTPQLLKVRNVTVFAPVDVGYDDGNGERTVGKPLIDVKDMPNANYTFDAVKLGDDNTNDHEEDEVRAALVQEYGAEVAKARARAEKFNVTFKEPAPDAFLKWSQAKMLRENPSSGFVTGIDIMSEEEKKKIEARKKRFGSMLGQDTSKRKQQGLNSDEEEEEIESEAVGSAVEDSKENNGENYCDSNANDISAKGTFNGKVKPEEAWDNEEMLREHRADPISGSNRDSSFADTGKGRESSIADGIDTFPSDEMEHDNLENMLIRERLHLQCLDWAAFKQIRSQDIMAHFSAYGPSFVEWLSDLSCNVVFADKYSTSRALNALSNEIPSPPPATGIEGAMLPDLGKMGWRICSYPIRKISNDRFGRAGTRSRYLVRIATTYDSLDKRPKGKSLKPPPGFTTSRVLGPGSDNVRVRGRGNARYQQSSKGHYDNNNNVNRLSRRRRRPKRVRRETDSREERDEFRQPDLDSALRCPR